MKPYTLRISSDLYRRLAAHLFPGDGDEHGAVLTAGLCTTDRGVRLLARDLFIARDGIDYVPGRHGYRALTTDFIMRVSDYCVRNNLCYLAVHCHGGDDYVDFSPTDLESHRRGYPALVDILNGGPMGALVFAHNAAAGQIWSRDGISPLDSVVIVGANHRRLFPSPPAVVGSGEGRYHRQSLLFGDAGQQILRGSKVGIIGLGGAGSLINQWAAHLGIGEIVGIDFDKLTPTNRPRVVGSTDRDAMAWLANSPQGWLRRLAWRFARYKVDIAARVARQAQPGIRYRALVGDVTDEAVARELRDLDYLFLCADSHQSRHVFNTLVHQYLIPGVQMGVKVPVERDTGIVGDVFAINRPVLPEKEGGCLWCNEVISPVRLQEEALSAEERAAQKYVEDSAVAAPSVITLNATACALAANDFLLGYFGLLQANARRGYAVNFVRDRTTRSIECRADEICPTCGTGSPSAYAMGDRAGLPCRRRSA